MPKLSVYDLSGAQTGEIELNDSVFGAEFNEAVVHQAVVMQLANQRQGTSATKTRAMVRGGGRKPWKQKRYWPRSLRFQPFSRMGWRWYHFWSPTPQLCKENAS